MSGYNKVIMMGNVGRDPEIKTFDSGKRLAKWSMAIKTGKEAEWFDFESWNKADFVEQWVKKGTGLLVEGELKIDKWEKDGEKKSRPKINVYSMTFAGGKSEPKPQEPDPDFSNDNSDDLPF